MNNNQQFTFGAAMNYNKNQQELPNNLSYSQMTNMTYGTDKPDIAKFMREFNDKHREKFNRYWFERDDDSIIENIEQIILSCQRDKYFMLKVLNFEVIKDYEEIQNTLYEYYAARSKKNGKKIDNPYDFIDLRDSDIMLLKVRYYIKLNLPEDKIRVDTKTGKYEQTEGEIDVLIELPRYINKYYFRIQGNYYNPIFQIVDGSTYNNATSNSKVQTVTLKTPFMPIKVYKEYNVINDCIDKSPHKCVLFTSYVFTKKTDAIKFILGRFGLYGAIEFLEIGDIYIGPYQEDENKHPIPIMDPEIYYNFASDPVQVKSDKKLQREIGDHYVKIIVAVAKRVFDKDNITQSFVYTILKNVRKLENYMDIYDPRYWNRSLGGDFLSATLDKGIPVLDSFESIYDIKTRASIRLPIEDKADSYRILRWIMREFNFLRNKDNLDISTKRPRMADEYLATIYAMKLSRGIYRITDKGKNVTFKDVTRVIDIAPNYILKNINATNLVDYVNLVNDNDAELALAYTYKGISGLGDQGGGTAVPLIYRSVHPSHLGKIDLDSSSASDPGLSGTICPMAKVYDGSFSDYVEPNGWYDYYTEMVNDFHNLIGMKQALEIKEKLGYSYDDVKYEMVKETIATYKRYLPGLIDLAGKKDYTVGAIIVDDNIKVISSSGSTDDDTGEITASMEDNPVDDEVPFNED